MRRAPLWTCPLDLCVSSQSKEVNFSFKLDFIRSEQPAKEQPP